MKTDPVCGMEVPDGKSVHTEHSGEIYYFCSDTCLQKFKASPEKYIQTISSTIYTCPMHPEIVQDNPGSCPKCGMTLEPRTVEAEEDTSELDDMTRRFWVSTLLAIPVFFSAMAAEFWPDGMAEFINPKTRQWIEMALSAPVVWWGGWIFFVRGWRSIVTRNLNMFTLIALGVCVAWSYSFIGVVLPGIFPAAMFNQMKVIPVYFEAASVITALVLLGQVLELRARRLSRATMRNIRQNLFLAFVYNAAGVPIAAGVLYPFFGILLSPIIAAAAMSFSSVSVITNALRLKNLKL